MAFFAEWSVKNFVGQKYIVCFHQVLRYVFCHFFWVFFLPCNHLSGASHNQTVSTCILSLYQQTFDQDYN